MSMLRGCRLYERQPYWTAVASLNGGHAPALLEMKGVLEPGIESGSLHPAVLVDDEVVSAEDFSKVAYGLADGCLPMPSIRFCGHSSAIALSMDILVHHSDEDAPVLLARYGVTNARDTPRETTLTLTYMNYKVQPPAQHQDDPKRAKAGRIVFNRLDSSKGRIESETDGAVTRIELLTTPDRVTDRRLTGEGFDDRAVEASYRFRLGPGESGAAVIAVPYGDETSWLRAQSPAEVWRTCFEHTRAAWRAQLSPIAVDIPEGPRPARTLKYSAAVALMHRRDGLFIGGPRVYDNTVWLRDGAYVAKMLLRCAIPTPVVEFIESYATIIDESEDDIIPCGRGPALYPGIVQYDALGQWIHLLAETYRFTGDETLLRRHWPSVLRSLAAIKRLSASGVMERCASHEGYGLGPDTYQRTVWVNAWTLRGLKDGIFLGQVMRDGATRLSVERDLETFRDSFYDAIRTSMSQHEIAFIPGSLDLGDPDPNAVVLLGTLCDEWEHLSQDLQTAYLRSLDMLFEHYRERRSVPLETNDMQFGPFEFRVVEGLVRLGAWERAHELFEYLMNGQRPPDWLAFADQIWCDPERKAYVADRPHPWGHADFAGTLRSMLLDENESADVLVVGKGVHPKWLKNGLSVRDLPTSWGALSFSLAAGGTHCSLAEGRGGFQLPKNGITVAFPGTVPQAIDRLPRQLRLMPTPSA